MENFQIRSYGKSELAPVSYTHLDVYKRQFQQLDEQLYSRCIAGHGDRYYRVTVFYKGD